MSVLIEELKGAEQAMSSGSMSLDALDAATVSARELYERLVVLRHKAREQAAAKPKVAPAPPPPPAPAPKPAAAEKKPAAPSPAPPPPPAPVIRLSTQPASRPEPAVAVEEKEEAPVMRTAAEFLKEALAAKARTGETVGEKLENARIGDLARAITLSDKFWFTKEIFGGDAKAYEMGVSLLNSAKDRSDALAFLHDELIAKLKTPPDSAAVEAFTDLLHRRFA